MLYVKLKILKDKKIKNTKLIKYDISHIELDVLIFWAPFLERNAWFLTSPWISEMQPYAQMKMKPDFWILVNIMFFLWFLILILVLKVIDVGWRESEETEK